jgi:hypothetical protein
MRKLIHGELISLGPNKLNKPSKPKFQAEGFPGLPKLLSEGGTSSAKH